jgi:hypothetical protein
MKQVLTETRKQTLTLMTTALGFVAALVWKDAMQAWLAPLYADASGAMGLTYAAIVVTVVIVVLTMIITRVLAPKEAKEE